MHPLILLGFWRRAICAPCRGGEVSTVLRSDVAEVALVAAEPDVLLPEVFGGERAIAGVYFSDEASAFEMTKLLRGAFWYPKSRGGCRSTEAAGSADYLAAFVYSYFET